ncbi:MAG: hypothetical protein J5804_01160 [Eggerthellaceae bacterium]|nr:hypothetical protein [Eggerthellaceae bacterium]
MRVMVAEHALKHGLSEADIRYAWKNYIRMQQRPAPKEEYVAAVGYTRTGVLIQMVAIAVEDGHLVIHAMAPLTNKVLKELGMAR